MCLNKVPVTVWGQKLMLERLKYLRGPHHVYSLSRTYVNEISNDPQARTKESLVHSLELEPSLVYDSILLQ